MIDQPGLQGYSQIIAVIGGTGDQGMGLCYRWAKAGKKLIIGTRDITKGANTIDQINQRLGSDSGIIAMTYMDAANAAEIVVLAVPYQAHQTICEQIKPYVYHKIVVDVTVPLVPPKITRVHMPEAGSATMEAQEILGGDTRVVAAFQNISHTIFFQDDPKVDCDVLVCGGDDAARNIVLELVRSAGFNGLDAGWIENAMVVEGLTSVLLWLNKKYGSHSAGIRITGISRE